MKFLHSFYIFVILKNLKEWTNIELESIFSIKINETKKLTKNKKII